MINTRRIFWSFSFILIIILVIGCSRESPTPDQMDKSPFTGIPCAAPCWYGLTIGESNESNLTSTLSTLTFINQSTIQRFQKSYVESNELEIKADCIMPRQHCFTFYFIENILSEIDMTLNYEIKLYEAVEFLGNPDYIVYRVSEPEHLICEIFAIWKSNQLVLSSQRYSGDDVKKVCGNLRDNGKPYSNMLISDVYFLQDEKIELIMVNPEWVFKYSGMIQDQ